MKPHEFHKKYANIPLGERHLVKTCMSKEGYEAFSSYEIYTALKTHQHAIRFAEGEIEKLMEIAEKILTTK